MGCALSPSRGLGRLSLWHETADATGRRARRCPATPTSTSRSSAPGSPGCGPPTTWPRPTRRCGSRCSRPRRPGFGASGRNGGWCSALFPASLATLAALPGRATRAGLHRAMRATVDEVLAVAAAEGIDAHGAKGGTIALARTPRPAGAGPGRGRARPRVGSRRGRRTPAGRRPRRRERLDGAGHARRRRTPRTARRSTPRRLVRGLADGGRAARRARSTSGPRSRRSSPAGRRPTHGTVRADVVVRATEGYTGRSPAQRPRRGAGLLADRRDRAAAGRRRGTGSGCASARRSPTTGT